MRTPNAVLSIVLLLLISSSLLAQAPVSEAVARQISDVLRIKNSLTRAQQKESSELIFAGRRARKESLWALPDYLTRQIARADGTVLVDIKTNNNSTVAAAILAAGGQVVSDFPKDHEIRARLSPFTVDTVASDPGVRWIRTADEGGGGVGASTSQGYVTHLANQAQALGFDGTGVKVGVLSDSASPARVAALITTGDLPPDVVVVPGQVGIGADEGTAMMEIVHDLAPAAKLFFATAASGQASFANNIRTLRFVYGCDIIVDDWTYFAEGAFQDDTIAKAVNDVTASGALYFSDAANSGNVDSGTAGTWEGDFTSGGDAGLLIDGFEGRPVAVHNFSSADAPQLFDTLTAVTNRGIYLEWSDPLGRSSNDYDLFILDSTGTTLKGLSIGRQNGTQNPVEGIAVGTNCGTAFAFGYCPAVGDRILVVLYQGVQRAIRIDTERGQLALATSGNTFGHNAGLNTVSTAATYWNSAHAGTQPFTGFANPVEMFSSDGPRKIFYNPDGTAITPGNFLFSTAGGTTLQKPDLTAADGVFTKTPGFLPFFGTSAAAPHAAAIAALVKSANPALSNVQIRQILLNTAVDNMAPGVDRDSGYGITMALPAVISAVNP